MCNGAPTRINRITCIPIARTAEIGEAMLLNNRVRSRMGERRKLRPNQALKCITPTRGSQLEGRDGGDVELVLRPVLEQEIEKLALSARAIARNSTRCADGLALPEISWTVTGGICT
eukprot:scaffold307583_cov32-Tisochrysis_lutea.AAC.3